MRPVSTAETATGLGPVPGSEEQRRVRFVRLVVPYSNSHLRHFPAVRVHLAFSVAVVWATDEAGLVSTLGGFGGIVKVSSEPVLVPPAFVAEIRKW